ncbi:MAG: hypothetical protein R2733_04280 [Acidimicrobiales bacterium]
MTARWVVDEVAPARGLNITWQPISLLFKNEPAEDSDYYAPVLTTHKMLRVFEAVRAANGDAPLGELYYEYGRRIHHDKDRDFDIADALTAVGLDPELASAADDEAWDAEIRTRMDAGLELTGQDVGTPIIAFNDRKGVKQAYFGPVISAVPPTEDSLAMWDALVAMMNVEGFWELKRSRTVGPQFGERP